MKINVQMISKQNIRPSSPTPAYLRHYQLSFLDQNQHPVFIPSISFYPYENKSNSAQHCEKMKKTLSQALTIFYPLAGRIKENNYIDCNDEGLCFVEAKANCHLSDILNCRDPGDNNNFIPLEMDDGAAETPALVQVTSFECGGLALFFGMTHKVGDGFSLFMFLNYWAAVARGDTDVITPRFESAVLFPPMKEISSAQPKIVKEKNIVMKRFVFDASTMATLREKYTVDGTLPTRIVALSALIWSRFVAATQAETDEREKLYKVFHTVNLRPRMDQPLANNYFGNIYTAVVTEPRTAEKHGILDIVNQIRGAISKVNTDYVKKLQETNRHLDFFENAAASFVNGELVTFAFTSFCSFPVYDADFGWGKPVWVGSIPLDNYKNVVCFYDTKSGDGIEAWINLKKEDMAKFGTDEEFLSHVSPSQNV